MSTATKSTARRWRAFRPHEVWNPITPWDIHRDDVALSCLVIRNWLTKELCVRFVDPIDDRGYVYMVRPDGFLALAAGVRSPIPPKVLCLLSSAAELRFETMSCHPTYNMTAHVMERP